MTEHVKIIDIPPRIQYTANGVLTTYSFPFVIFKASDIDVYLDGEQQDDTSYTVTGVRNSDGGSVIFTVAPAENKIVTLVRNLPIERTSDFQEGGILRSDTLNDELDYQIACQQQIADSLNRTLVLPPYAIDSDVDFTLPFPEAGKAIVWTADGKSLENSNVAVNEMDTTLRGYKTAAETAAETATTKAGIASDKADLATEKAQVATDKAAEAIATLDSKANKDFSNISTNFDYVVQSYGPDANGAWYRVYHSKWVEQGGSCSGATITFLKAFADTKYSFIHNTTETTNYVIFNYTKATTGITNIRKGAYGANNAANDSRFSWIAIGKGV